MRPLRRDERGSITPFAVIVALAILMLAALIVDGGRQLNAKGRAVAYAQEAARAGSQVVDISDPRLDLVPGQAMSAASEYCRQAMAADTQLIGCTPHMTTVHDDAGTFAAVSVTTHVEVKSILLGLVHLDLLEATGRAVARPVSGISGPDSGKQSTVGPPVVGDPEAGEPPPTAPPAPDVTVAPCEPKPTKPPKPPKEADREAEARKAGQAQAAEADQAPEADAAPVPRASARQLIRPRDRREWRHEALPCAARRLLCRRPARPERLQRQRQAERGLRRRPRRRRRRSTPTATPTPKPTKPPQGKYGVTVEVLNAGRYGSDPVVRSWRANLEALAGSVNRKKLLPGLSASLTPAFRHRAVQVLQQAWSKNWRAAKVQKVRVVSVSTSGGTARLVGCSWKPSTDYRDRSGKVVGGLTRKWDQVPFQFKRVGSVWKLDEAEIPTGFCRLPPPA